MSKQTVLTLNKSERRALNLLLMHSESVCRSGCAYPEMQASKKGCNSCPFVSDVNNIMNKLGMCV
ncbi:MAG: hypothetical protein E7H54_05335 [Clostridium perfringens]|nr:hypothetical protein [Clostridium perfringens]